MTSLESSNNSASKTANQYTITKKQLIGTWGTSTEPLKFTENNCDVIRNWIIVQDDRYDVKKDVTFYYMYKDGKLYIAGSGGIFSKQK